jgi:flagellar basal-body rod protein FlgG
MLALYTAASGMAAMEKNVELISNNVANVRTTGYKLQRPLFQDLLYETLKRSGSSTSDAGNMLPAGIEIGSGVKLVSTSRAMSQGSITATDRNLDVAIRGEGFFRIQRPDGTIGYTRDGSFTTDSQGQLVTSQGMVLDPGITIPTNATNISISASGLVQVQIPGQAAPQDVGKIQLTHFANKSGLEAIGDNLFAQTAASGDPVTADPGTDGLGDLQQGYLEESNVNAVTEISSLITAQRAYEMNSRVISAADQMQQTTTQMFKG